MSPVVIENLDPRRLLASVSGLVWNDIDASNTFDESENPYPNVTVYIDANRNARLDSGEIIDFTDSDGAYQFTGLASGTYDIRTVHPAGVGTTTPGRLGTIEHQFDIGINYLSEMTPAQSRAFEMAASRWEAIIVGDLPDVTTDIGVVDDIVIDASIIDIDGGAGTLAQAEPTAFRAGTNLPSRGVIEFDLADIGDLEDEGKLFDTITHEMAHVLGFGTIWEIKNLLANTGGSTPIFTGTRATAAYEQLFGVNVSGVPVEGGGGPGTDLSHWRETSMLVEQMSGFTEAAGTVEPISLITIQQFADLGYTVNLAAADSYNPLGGNNRYWTPADAGVDPFARRVVLSGSSGQNDIDFGLRVNKAPAVTSFTITPSPASQGDLLTMTARAVDPNADQIVGMTFYRESNGQAGLQASGDTYIATKFNSRRGVFAVTTLTDGLSGANIFYASAVDPMLFAGRGQATVQINAYAIPPTRPAPLVATRPSASRALLQWKDRSLDEIGFRIEVATTPTFLAETMVKRYNVPTNTVNSLVTGLPAGTFYYRIRAYNPAGASAYTRVGPV